MLRRRHGHGTTAASHTGAFADFHDWVLSLPWVLERPYISDAPGVRSFAVECDPLGIRRLWLLTGVDYGGDPYGLGLAVIVPDTCGAVIETAHWGHRIAPMPGEHALVTVGRESFAHLSDVEALVLTAYCHALS
jgi:hypothetical protein